MVLGYLGEDNQRAYFFEGQTEHFKSLKKLNDPDWIEIQPLEVWQNCYHDHRKSSLVSFEAPESV